MSRQPPTAKSMGIVMSIAILVAVQDGPVYLPDDRRPTILVQSGDHVRTARALSAAAGHRGCNVVGSSPADAELLVLPETDRSPPRDPLIPSVVRYDEQILAALLPGCTVLVGSVRIHAPSQAWLVDSGSEMVRLGPSLEEFVASPPVVLYADLNLLKSPAVGLQSGIGQKIVLRTDVMQGVRLRDGDRIVSPPLKGYDHTLLDADGAPALVQMTSKQAWQYRTGALYSHILFRLLAHDVRMRGPNVLVPRLADSTRTPVEDGDRVHLTLVWDDGKEQAFDALAAVEAGGAWTLTLRTRLPLVLDPLGTCYGKPGLGARECVTRGGVYDRPCTHDTECPYFDPRTASGRCLDGTCGMPLGVGNASFRRADSATPPMMAGCDPDDPSYPYCEGLPATSAIFGAVVESDGGQKAPSPGSPTYNFDVN
jgi:hypothetical protein